MPHTRWSKPHPSKVNFLYISTMYRLVNEGNILKAVEDKIGKLNTQAEFKLADISNKQ